MANNNYIIEKSPLEIAQFISSYYKQKEFANNANEEYFVSSIRMQKTLYFLFAYWIKEYHIENLTKTKEINEMNDDNLSDKLFKTNFKAGRFGPIDLNVLQNKEEYLNIKSGSIPIESITNNKYVQDYMISILDEVYEINDFSLVKISHEDNCWKANISKIIPETQIIDSYKAYERLNV